MSLPVRKWRPLIPSHGIKKATCAGYTAICTIDEADRKHQCENHGGRTAARGLMHQFGDWHVGRGRQNDIGICEAE